MPETTTEVVITARYDDQASPGLERLRDDVGALGESARSFGVYEEQINRAGQSAERFRQTYHGVMEDLADVTRTALEQYVAGSFMAMTKALATLVSGAKGGAKQFAKAMLELSAAAILAIGQQAAIKAVFALAEFFLFKDPMSLVAAKLYGAVAAMSMAAGAGLMAAASGGGDGGGGGGRGGGGGGGGSSRKSSKDEEGGDNFVVNVYVQGHVVDSQAFVEDVVAPALAEAVGRGASGRSRYNLQTRRD